MLDLGFRPQLINIFDLLPEKDKHHVFCNHDRGSRHFNYFLFLVGQKKVQIALSGTPLDNISQTKYSVPNYYTKVNLLSYLLRDKEEMEKVLVFVSSKKIADRLFDQLEEVFVSDIAVIHSNKSQNYRFKSIRRYDEGSCRVLVQQILLEV